MIIIKKEESVGYLFALEKKGGAGSGNFGHAGVPGKVGGSGGGRGAGGGSGSGEEGDKTDKKFPRGKNPDGGGAAKPGDKIRALGKWSYVVGEHSNYYLVQPRAPKQNDFNNPPLNGAVHRSDVEEVKITEYSQ